MIPVVNTNRIRNSNQYKMICVLYVFMNNHMVINMLYLQSQFKYNERIITGFILVVCKDI